MVGTEMTAEVPMDNVCAGVMPGVIDSIFAEGEEGGFADAGDGGDGGELDLDLGDEGDEGAGAEGEGAAKTDGEQQAEEKIDGRKGSKEFREALKAWEATPEGAKFAKTARADHFRMQELASIEPGGVAALREKYALLESVGGPEAITQLQERVAAVDATDEALAAGNPEALQALGPEFDSGLAKLTPQILERVMKADPAAYSAAILPHLMSGLAGSPLVADLNRMVDVFGAAHLDEAGKMTALRGLLGRIGAWFEANEKKVGELKSAPVDKERAEFDKQRSEFEQTQVKAHWEGNIYPPVRQFVDAKFEELFKPYQAKLKLDGVALADAKKDFIRRLEAAGNADANYIKQIDLYRKQGKPVAATVVNFAKSGLSRHAKATMESLIKERGYGRFMGAARKPGTAAVAGARAATGTAGAAATVVSVKPSPAEIDYRKTSEADQWKGLYTLKSGKRVQWRRPA